MLFASLLPLFLGACLASARGIRRNQKRAPPSNFVTTSGSEFLLNGSAFKFVGTNAYWLHTLNNDQDISNTFGNMTAAGINVVRTWAFNDVHEIPATGPWFALIANGTVTINNGANGLQRLDRVVQLAEQHGIYLIMSLTNNWNPFNATVPSPTVLNATSDTNITLNRNVLSSDYGGMDAYVRQFGVQNFHDEFYTNATILSLFKNYTSNIVSRYVNSPAILGWELANDPRCNSSLPSNKLCTPQTVTKWHSTLAQHVKSVDPNHIVSSGSGGFFCTGCPKLFPKKTAPVPNAQPSGAPSAERRHKVAKRKGPAVITRDYILKERIQMWKQSREEKKRSGTLAVTEARIRGRWTPTPTRRQSTALGSAYDGSQGVDSEDILGIPQIGFSSFQLFPDQTEYGPNDPNLAQYNNTVQNGVDWIQKQTQTGQGFGKPVVATGFGLVTQSNAPDYVPFNSTSVAPTVTATGVTNTTTSSTSSGVSDSERDNAYQTWLQAGIESGVNGMMQYQWSQIGLTPMTGTTVTANSTTTAPNTSGNPTTPNVNSTGVSPNDGYGIQGSGQDGVTQIIQSGSQSIGQDASS